MPLKKISEAARAFATKVLAIDNTAQPKEHIRAIRELLCKNGVELNGDSLPEVLSKLKQKHLVDSVIVTKRDGSILATTEQNGIKQAITGTALFNYVSSELEKTESVLIKSNGDWFMVFPFGEKIFVVKAAASLSTVELKALAKELDNFLKGTFFEANNKAF